MAVDLEHLVNYSTFEVYRPSGAALDDRSVTDQVFGDVLSAGMTLLVHPFSPQGDTAIGIDRARHGNLWVSTKHSWPESDNEYAIYTLMSTSRGSRNGLMKNALRRHQPGIIELDKTPTINHAVVGIEVDPTTMLYRGEDLAQELGSLVEDAKLSSVLSFEHQANSRVAAAGNVLTNSHILFCAIDSPNRAKGVYLFDLMTCEDKRDATWFPEFLADRFKIRPEDMGVKFQKYGPDGDQNGRIVELSRGSQLLQRDVIRF